MGIQKNYIIVHLTMYYLLKIIYFKNYSMDKINDNVIQFFFIHDNFCFWLIQNFKIYLTNEHEKFLSRDILYLFFDTKKKVTLCSLSILLFYYAMK